jgi:hypothetical protein
VPVGEDCSSRDLARTEASRRSAGGWGGASVVGEVCRWSGRTDGGQRGGEPGGSPATARAMQRERQAAAKGRGWNRDRLGFPGPVGSFIPSISWTVGWIQKTARDFLQKCAVTISKGDGW